MKKPDNISPLRSLRSFAAIQFSLFLFMTSNLCAASWEQLPSLPEETGNFACGIFDGKIVTLGGIVWKNDTKLWLDTIRCFDVAGKTWSEIGKLPHPLAYPAFAQTAKGIYFAGGSDGKTANGAFYCFDRKFALKKIGEIPQPLLYSGSAIAGDKLVVVCGLTDAADLKTITSAFYSIDLETGKTAARPDFPAGKQILPATCAVGNRIFAFTGAYMNPTDDTKVVNVSSAFVFSTAQKTWKPIKPYPLALRGLAGCALDERHILLGGGYENDFRDDAFIYDTKTDSYSRTTPLPYRSMSNFVRDHEYVYWLGGEDKMRHRSNLFYRIALKDLLREASLVQ
jgi:N-acetylneuraminic acid mutarotase